MAVSPPPQTPLQAFLSHARRYEQVQFLRTLVKWLFLGSLAGALAGIASAIFLISLAWATAFRTANPALLFGLPLAGFVIGWFYLRFAGVASRGNNLVIEEVNLNQGRIPLRMAPMVLAGSTDYLGLSLPLIQASMDGSGVIALAFLLKLIFTTVTLGTGFLGGEVTPLFVIGATLGYTLGRLLGIDPAFLAAVGFVAVFAGASNTPLACTLMGVELFGGGAVMYLAVGCFVAYLASGHRGIYNTQIIGVPKNGDISLQPDESLEAFTQRRLQNLEESSSKD